MNKELLDKLLADPLYGPVIKGFVAQQEKGIDKYASLLSLGKWTVLEYLEHLQQELTDGLVYLEGLQQHLSHPEQAAVDAAQTIRQQAQQLAALQKVNKDLASIADSRTKELERWKDKANRNARETLRLENKLVEASRVITHLQGVNEGINRRLKEVREQANIMQDRGKYE